MQSIWLFNLRLIPGIGLAALVAGMPAIAAELPDLTAPEAISSATALDISEESSPGLLPAISEAEQDAIAAEPLQLTSGQLSSTPLESVLPDLKKHSSTATLQSEVVNPAPLVAQAQPEPAPGISAASPTTVRSVESLPTAPEVIALGAAEELGGVVYMDERFQLTPTSAPTPASPVTAAESVSFHTVPLAVLAELSDQVALDRSESAIELASDPPPTGLSYVPSRAINLLALRAFKKPVGAYPLDSGVFIAGIEPRSETQSFWTRDFLTGDWGGLRTELYNNGIDITLAHFFDVFGVVGGGQNQDTAYSGATTISFDFYTDRMGWWDNGQVHWTMAWLEGPSVGRLYAGSFNSVYDADPTVNGFRLFELWYGHRFPEADLEVRIGKNYQFVKIAALQSSSIFQNTSFDYPSFMGTTPGLGYGVSYPQAPFGLQFLYDPSRAWFVYAGVFDGFDDPSGGPDNRRGVNVGIDLDREGVEGILEVGHRINQNVGDTGLPGVYRVGFQFHTGEFLNNNENTLGGSLAIDGGTPATERGNIAFYFTADQMLFSENEDRTEGLNGFFKVLVVPEQDINFVSWNIAAGLAYAGLIPGRDRDVVGLAVSHTRFNDGIRQFDRDNLVVNPGGAVRDGETVIELLYAAEVTPWWFIIGSLQHIIHPAGFDSTPNATVLGVSNRIAF